LLQLTARRERGGGLSEELEAAKSRRFGWRSAAADPVSRASCSSERCILNPSRCDVSEVRRTRRAGRREDEKLETSLLSLARAGCIPVIPQRVEQEAWWNLGRALAKLEGVEMPESRARAARCESLEKRGKRPALFSKCLSCRLQKRSKSFAISVVCRDSYKQSSHKRAEKGVDRRAPLLVLPAS